MSFRAFGKKKISTGNSIPKAIVNRDGVYFDCQEGPEEMGLRDGYGAGN